MGLYSMRNSWLHKVGLMINAIFKSVVAFAPATVANVGPGFDIFGLALSGPGDRVTVRPTKDKGVRINRIQGDGGLLPTDAKKNTAGVACIKLSQALGLSTGIEIDLQKNLPLKSGLGSSAASSVAAVLAANHLFGSPFRREELLPFVVEAERIACGAAHADNVAPCLLGGFSIVRDLASFDIIRVPIPDQLSCTVIHPHVELSTRQSRAVLPAQLNIDDVSRQCGNASALVSAFFLSDYELIARSLADVLAEPARKHLIPYYDSMKGAAMEAGALGFGISGSGPSVFALCKGKESAKMVTLACESVLRRHDMGVDSYSSMLTDTGARVVEVIS